MDIAYRQIYVYAKTLLTRIAILYKLAFLSMQLPFGTIPVPEEYKYIIEAEIDLGNDLLREKLWYIENISSIHRTLLPKENKQQSSNHLVKTDTLVVDTAATQSSTDRFVNDIITIANDEGHWIERAKSAALLVIHTLFRPLQPSITLKQDDPIYLRGYVGKGKISKH